MVTDYKAGVRFAVPPPHPDRTEAHSVSYPKHTDVVERPLRGDDHPPSPIQCWHLECVTLSLHAACTFKT